MAYKNPKTKGRFLKILKTTGTLKGPGLGSSYGKIM